jgi:hypothetical protein
VKVENEGVHCKRYEGYYMKQQIKIPMATWTSPIQRRRFRCRTSFNEASLMKDDVKIEVPNKTPKILILSDEVINWDGMLKTHGWPCYAFLRLDKKTYSYSQWGLGLVGGTSRWCMICYNWRGN